MSGRRSRRTQTPLHDPALCLNTPQDVTRIESRLTRDPTSINRKTIPPHNTISSMLTPAENAAIFGHDNCMEFLVRKGSRLNPNTDVMMLTISTLKYKCLQLLLQNGFNANFNCKKDPARGCTFFLYLIICGTECPEIVQLFIEHGAKVDDFRNFNARMIDYFEYAPTVVAVYYKTPECLKVLLSHGAAIDHYNIKQDINPEMQDNMSLIHHHVLNAGKDITSLRMDVHILNILYELGANLWQKNRLGFNPLDVRLNKNAWISERRARGISADKDRVMELAFYSFSQTLSEYMTKPRSLQSLCRVVVMRTMRHKYMTTIDTLSLPETVKEFLNMTDLKKQESIPFILYGIDM